MFTSSLRAQRNDLEHADVTRSHAVIPELRSPKMTWVVLCEVGKSGEDAVLCRRWIAAVQLSGQGFSVTSQDIRLVTRPQVARRRPMVVRIQDMLPSAIFLPSFQQ